MMTQAIQKVHNVRTVNVKELIHKLRELVKLWRRRYATRQQLASFDDRMLKDIGISRFDAMQESEKPFWKE